MASFDYERKRILFGDWEPVTGDPDQDALLMALRAIEAREGERRGWDRPARLYAAYLADLDAHAIELRVIPPRRWQTGAANPADDLARTANRLPDPPTGVPVLPFADAPDGAAAAILMYEGWTRPDDADVSPEEQARRAAGERTYRTRPDRLEVRMLMAVDINARCYALRRIRGQQPEARALQAAETRGRVPWALGRLAGAMRTGAWPT